jgi:hypothetical protein
MYGTVTPSLSLSLSLSVWNGNAMAKKKRKKEAYSNYLCPNARCNATHIGPPSFLPPSLKPLPARHRQPPKKSGAAHTVTVAHPVHHLQLSSSSSRERGRERKGGGKGGDNNSVGREREREREEGEGQEEKWSQTAEKIKRDREMQGEFEQLQQEHSQESSCCNRFHYP